MYTPFFDELLKDYGFAFSMAEAMNGIKHISDPLDVEDVLYTMQGALCHTKEECDVFEAVFCKRFLHYTSVPAVPKTPKKPNKSIASFLNMTDNALDEFLRKTRTNRERAAQEVEKQRNSKPSRDEIHKQEQLVSDIADDVQGKRLAALDADIRYQAAVTEATISGSQDLIQDFERLFKQCKALTDGDLACYGISEKKLHDLVCEATTQSVTAAQKSVMSAAVLARKAKEPDLYKTFISLAQVFQALSKSVKRTQSGIEDDERVRKAKETVKETKQQYRDACREYDKESDKLNQLRDKVSQYDRELRECQKKVSAYDDILADAEKAIEEKQRQNILKNQSVNHRDVFKGGHNAVRTKNATDKLLNEDVAQLSRADIEKVLTYIRTNAKTFRQKLRKLYMTQQKKQIDIKKTIEKSVQCDGEIAKLYYKKPIKSKANIVMLADISGSCRTMTSLALTYMGLMREVFPGGCRLFVFVNHLVSVDHYFSNENVTAAVDSINQNVPSRGIYSDYGVPLRELRYDNTGIINKDTTIVMLGDCRNNKNYTGEEEVKWLSKRAASFFVLNPEPRDEWGQGDSIADLYAKSGAVVSQVGSAKDLLTFLQSAGTTRHF
jgi:uncharacterized protein with von Willebrand factor type A (vWA) domain